ncbi:hypothetical protein GVAV_000662 [Gurleya vavrai]
MTLKNFFYFFKDRNNFQFSEILLYLAKYHNNIAKLYYERNDIKCIFLILQSEHFSFNNDLLDTFTILNIIHSFYLIFDKSSSFDLLSKFYRFVHLIFTNKNSFVFLGDKILRNYFFFKFYKFYDLLLFMKENHSYMFDEFFENTGLKEYFEIEDIKCPEREIFNIKFKFVTKDFD